MKGRVSRNNDYDFVKDAYVKSRDFQTRFQFQIFIQRRPESARDRSARDSNQLAAQRLSIKSGGLLALEGPYTGSAYELLALLPERTRSELVKSRKWRVLKNQIGRSVTVIELGLSFGPFVPAKLSRQRSLSSAPPRLKQMHEGPSASLDLTHVLCTSSKSFMNI
jgi:hypothetical protein